MAVQNTEYQIHIINKIKQLRVRAGMSQQQIAQILGITNGQVGNIESTSYSHKYTLRQLSLLAREFKVSVESLFLYDDERKLSNPELVDRICKYLEGE